MALVITTDTPGLLRGTFRDENLVGKVMVVAPERLGERYRCAKFQLYKVTGGFGADPTKIGTKVFGKYVLNPGDEDGYWLRGDFIGEATPELIEAARKDPGDVLPVDKTRRNFMAINTNRMTYAHGDTARDAIRDAGGRGKIGKSIKLWYLHHEAYVDDFCNLRYPDGVTTADCPAIEIMNLKDAARIAREGAEWRAQQITKGNVKQ